MQQIIVWVKKPKDQCCKVNASRPEKEVCKADSNVETPTYCSIKILDEKEKYDPTGFRDAVIAGLEKAEDLEQISKYLDTAGNKLDYRRYGEVLFDILIAGGLLGTTIFNEIYL